MPPLQYGKPFVIPAKAEHTATVVVLHGLGDTCHGWSFVGRPEIWGRNLSHVKFVLPTAPVRPVTRNMGMPSTAWFDVGLRALGERVEDEEGIDASYRYLSDLVEREIQDGIAAEKIAVTGFSQGGVIALAMLRSSHKLAGIIGMSTFLAKPSSGEIVSEANRPTPVLMCHGIHDPMIDFDRAKASFEVLKTQVVNAEFRQYNMAHTACDEELDETRRFLESVL